MTGPSDPTARISRRQLFELGGTGAILATVLAACGGGGSAAPGRVGDAPGISALPDEPVDDAVYLRTMASLERSILGVYGRLQSDAGLEQRRGAAVERYVADHEAAAATLDELTTAAGGEAYTCPNPWYEQRFFGPTLDYIFGNPDSEPEEIPPSDDIPRDAMSFVHALESLSTSSYLRFVGLVSTKELRAALAGLGAAAARRSATAALYHNTGPGRYVAPALLELNPASPASEPEAPAASTETEPRTEVYALNSRFAQLVAVNLEVGAVNDVGLRYATAFETPAENAYVYAPLSC